MRVIQDSDDEFDEDLQDEVQSPRAGDASRHHGRDASSMASGTGSTESLKRAFAEAHRDHLQSPSTHFAVPSQDEPHSSVSLPEHVSKRMKTLHDDGPRISLPSSSSKKGPVTYGKERKSISSSPFLHLVDTQVGYNSPAPLHDTALGLEGTMREGYIEHDPMALFPEPSSTIPNATLTQQRMLEGVVVQGMLGLDSEADVPPHLPPPEASVTWSDMMKFSSGEHSQLSSQRAKGDAESETVQYFAEQNEEPPKSQRSRRGSSVRLRGSPLRNEVTLESIDPKDVMPPQLTLPSQDFALPSTASGASQSDSQEKNRKSSSQAKNKTGPIAGFEEDFAAIGLPTEQYKPRPSRSRSLKATPGEPIDFSVRPEKAAKGSKRRKTTNVTATTSTAEYITTPEKVKQICDMGFTPTSTGRALKQNNGDITVTVEWLITNGLGEDELASSNTPKQKPASKKANTVSATAIEPPSEPQIPPPPELVDDSKLTAGIETPSKPIATLDKSAPPSEINPAGAAQQRSPKVQVVIPMKSPNPKVAPKPDPLEPSSKKAKRRKTTSDLPESEATLNTTSTIDVTKEKKKGRGRPKKLVNTAIPAEPVVQNVPEEPQLGSEIQADTILRTIEPNTTNPVASMSDDAKDLPPAPVVTSKDSHSSGTPEQAIKPSSRSPLNKGKTPYRVGLSKRARIAPLLRMVKK